MLNLSNIELIALNCINPEDSVKALLYSSKNIKFGAIKLFSHYKPANLPDQIQWIQIPKLTYQGASWFSIEESYKHCNLDYWLSIHDDGFVINPHLWDNKFLEYDWVGAPWPPEYEWLYTENRPGNRVGNGGFVLKSKKLLKTVSQTIKYRGGSDDVMICNDFYHTLFKKGIKYAPVEIAMKFSLENPIPECDFNLNNTFGFHGKGHKGTQFQEKLDLLKEI